MSALNRNLLHVLMTLCVGGALLTPSAASATLFCNLKKTKDGFVALRAAPNADAKLIAKMRPQDEVMIGLGEQGKWVEVTWWRGDDRLSRRYGGRGVQGWAHGALIDDMCG